MAVSVLAAGSAGVGIPFRELALVLLVGLVATYLTTGIVRMLMVRFGPMSAPRARDVHTVPTPRLGGVAMFTGVIFAVLTASNLPALNRGFPPVVMAAAFVIVVVGVIDDLWDISWVLKLGGQVVGAVVMSIAGLSWYLIVWPVGDGTTLILDQVQSTVLTAVLTVAIINAMNFVDGLDGLAAGLGMIGGGTLLVYSLTVLHDQGGTVSAYPPAIISAVLVGVCAGFLPHNFSPARIFMGDSGSMLIGLLLSAACVSASGRINMSLYGTADLVALLSPILAAGPGARRCPPSGGGQEPVLPGQEAPPSPAGAPRAQSEAGRAGALLLGRGGRPRRGRGDRPADDLGGRHLRGGRRGGRYRDVDSADAGASR